MRTRQEVIDELQRRADRIDDLIIERAYATADSADSAGELSTLYRQAIMYLKRGHR